jgi:hypothetical protein
MSTTDSRPHVRVEIVDDAAYAAEIAELEALRDQVLHTLAESREPELARELLAGWPVLS